MRTLKSRTSVVVGHITRLAVDAIVNAANDRLASGAGVCGAIHRAAGPALADACRGIGGCPTGEARITPGFQLQAKYVIHAVGPVWRGGDAGEEQLLAACYRNSLALARAHAIGSIAFPAISTGIYGFPLECATRLAVDTVLADLAAHDRPARVVFSCFGAEVAALHRRIVAERT